MVYIEISGYFSITSRWQIYALNGWWQFELAMEPMAIGLVSLNSNSETHMTAICDARLIYVLCNSKCSIPQLEAGLLNAGHILDCCLPETATWTAERTRVNFIASQKGWGFCNEPWAGDNGYPPPLHHHHHHHDYPTILAIQPRDDMIFFTKKNLSWYDVNCTFYAIVLQIWNKFILQVYTLCSMKQYVGGSTSGKERRHLGISPRVALLLARHLASVLHYQVHQVHETVAMDFGRQWNSAASSYLWSN